MTEGEVSRSFPIFIGHENQSTFHYFLNIRNMEFEDGRKYYFPEVPGRNLTPSPSATAMICALEVSVKIAIAFFSNGIGRFESSEGMGGSTIS